MKPTREKLAGGFLFSDRKRKENALLRPDLKVDENTRLVNQASVREKRKNTTDRKSKSESSIIDREALSQNP